MAKIGTVKLDKLNGDQGLLRSKAAELLDLMHCDAVAMMVRNGSTNPREAFEALLDCDLVAPRFQKAAEVAVSILYRNGF